MPPVWSAVAELNGAAAGRLVEAEVDDPLADDAVDAFEVAELDTLDELEELDEGATGWKLEFLAPKPTFEANRPPTETETVLLFPVRTSLPPALSDAVTCAFFGPLVLIALIRSPTVSVPVDA